MGSKNRKIDAMYSRLRVGRLSVALRAVSEDVSTMRRAVAISLTQPKSTPEVYVSEWVYRPHKRR
jgi:hypothetical protein